MFEIYLNNDIKKGSYLFIPSYTGNGLLRSKEKLDFIMKYLYRKRRVFLFSRSLTPVGRRSTTSGVFFPRAAPPQIASRDSSARIPREKRPLSAAGVNGARV